ncbi:hypothetical protein PMAYCL1PPCAC_01273, partial [Pristionchus mayeri]
HLGNPKLRPTMEFIMDTLPTKYAPLYASANRRDILPLMRADHPVGRSLMTDIEEHIGYAKTRCFDCDLIFANAAEYFEHILYFLHSFDIPFQELDLITIVVNVQKKHLYRPNPPYHLFPY